MMKRVNRVFSLILVFVLVLACLPTSALAADVVDSGTCGDNLTWELTSDGTLIISGTGVMNNYGQEGFDYSAPWYDHAFSIRSVVIQPGVTTIGSSAFAGCSSITSVTIPDSVTSIGEFAFSGCRSLTDVTIPNGVTSIGEGAFYYCENMISVTIPDSVNAIGAKAFGRCVKLTNVVIPNGVSTIGEETFFYCSGLTGVTIPSSIVEIGDYAFSGCSHLADVTIPAGVVAIGENSFFECGSLTGITIPDTVASIGKAAFSRCGNMEEIIVDERNLHYASVDGVLFNRDQTVLLAYPAGRNADAYTIPDSVTTIDNEAFSMSNNLTSVIIPNSVTTIGRRAFYGCENLPAVTIPNSVTTIEDCAFQRCTGLTSITIPDSVSVICMQTFEYCSNLKSVTFSDSVTAIDRWAFNGCSSLRSITLPESVASIGMYAFHDCTSLREVAIYNPQCDICQGYTTCGYSKITVVRGYPNSTAQSYAEEWGFRFAEFGEEINPFTDVKETDWYYDAVMWAAYNGITSGTSETTFSPKEKCTRGQVVTFLWKLKGCPEPEMTENPFSDVKETDYFYKAVLWAVENGVTSGVGDGKFGAKDVCTRGQFAALMWNACNRPEPVIYYNPFSDIETTDYYYKAILWAVEIGMTAGTGNGQFSPREDCTRAQLVTFLFRYGD